MKLKDTCSLKEKLWPTWTASKKQRHYFADKDPSSRRYGLSNSHACMWELDPKEDWVLKNWYFWTVVLEKTLESTLDCKEIQPVNPKWNQPWIFIGRTDAGAETPVLWPPAANNWVIGKYPDAGKGWGQEEKWTTVDEMVGWHHLLDGHEFEQALGVGDEQGSLVCWSPWGCKESEMTERLNWSCKSSKPFISVDTLAYNWICPVQICIFQGLTEIIFFRNIFWIILIYEILTVTYPFKKLPLFWEIAPSAHSY